ncbi:MAG: aspartate-semialdehyde dehydrogenase [Erysipelotrichaceae bacterium]|nr:aspartate-semialdehyde dehydrogenase [Erysipelotrichaceae bacterium]
MKVGILGATGAVGREMLNSLIEYDLPVEELRLFASKRSLGTKLKFKDQEIEVREADAEGFKGLDYVLGAVSNELSKENWPLIKEAGAIYVDNSSAFRLMDDVPLVVPEINGEDALKHKGLIANPNCSTIISMMAVAPINQLSKIDYMVATTYQAVSGAGNKGIEALEREVEQLRNNEEITPDVFPKQIAYNCIAQIGSYLDNGYTTEEMKMQNEGRKILHLPELKVTCTCVRVPVYRSHSIAVTLVTEKKLDLDEVKEAIRQFPHLKLYEEGELPTPLEASDQNDVYVGRIRRDLTNEKGITLWCCGDQIRKGAAANAVEIIDYLEKHK